jgi:hypothetical protein
VTDEQELRGLVERYFHSLDHRDMSALGECFATDAHASYNDGATTVDGRDEIVREFAAIARFPSSIHVLANASVDVERREGVVYAVAYLTSPDEERILVRGLRYDDRYAHEDGQWRFQSREHHPLWQFEADAVPPRVPGR